MPDIPPRTPLGPPLDLSDADLEALAEIDEADVLDVHRFLQQHLPPRLRNLPLAEVEDEV